MKTIICTLCKTEKSASEFYKNKGMPSGYANQCKDCVKARSKVREGELRKNPEWAEKEKARHRDKYHRLNYKEKQLEWDKNKPWTRSSVYKGLHKKLKLTSKQSAHHWNYNFLKDVVILSKEFHKFFHKYLVFDEHTLCFKTMDGRLLHTRGRHDLYRIDIYKIFKRALPF